MTRGEVNNRINEIIQEAVQRSGGDWERSYRSEVEQIWVLVGKLTPEPKAKPAVPDLPPKLVARAKRIKDRTTFTEEQREAARAALRAVGLI